MNYFKFMPKIETKNSLSGVQEYTGIVDFVFPLREPYATSQQHKPNKELKPQLTLPFSSGNKIEPGEFRFSIKSGEPIKVKTLKEEIDWIGTTFKLRVNNNKACQGYFYISFETLQFLTEKEYNN